jgi:GNAT superfamily N-acetyltransferase
MTIREFEERDAKRASVLLRDLPWFTTPEVLLHWARMLPARAHVRHWVAEEGDELVGWAEAEFEWATEREDLAGVWVFVQADRRGHGIGSRLYERAVAHALEHGARELKSGAWEDDGHRFLVERGYEPARQERLSALDPRTVDTWTLTLPEGFRLLNLADLRGRERELHSLYSEASADMPADDPESNIGFEEWLDETLGDPTLSWDGSVVVLDGDTPVALAWIKVAGKRATNELTGTARAYRRRGLARTAKLATIRWCAQRGIERITTGNDSTNSGMLAINDELGYRPWITWQEYVLRP